VNLHCAMHSYRWGKFQQPVKAGDDNSHWYEMLGLQSTGHGAQLPIAIKFTDKEHPITKGMADWTTINEELYNNVQVLTGKGVATGTQTTPEKKDKAGKVTPAKENTTIVAWTNEYGPKKTRHGRTRCPLVGEQDRRRRQGPPWVRSQEVSRAHSPHRTPVNPGFFVVHAGRVPAALSFPISPPAYPTPHPDAPAPSCALVLRRGRLRG
ncbi:MAG: hypothetical protein RIR91_1522, partial [Verrucomicrobiota bacterium]